MCHHPDSIETKIELIEEFYKVLANFKRPILNVILPNVDKSKLICAAKLFSARFLLNFLGEVD